MFINNNCYASNYTMAYMYGGTKTTYLNYVQESKGMLDCISPDFFNLNSDGMLEVSKVDKEFVDTCHSAKISVVPCLNNHWVRQDAVNALAVTELLTQQIADAIYTHNLDGVNIDFQNLPETYKDSYSNFVKVLRAKIPDKQLSVAVAANPNGWTLGWHGSYDYRELAKYSDYLMIMGYDESYYTGPAGPVASKAFTVGAIEYALKYTTSDKIVLGTPFFGRYWKQGDSIGGNAITARDVENILKEYNAVKLTDDDKKSAKVSLNISESDILPKLWGGKTLTAGIYEIWYDDLWAFEYKLDLADSYNLKGTGHWALGQEDLAVWDIYSQRKQASVTPDTPEPEVPTPEPPVPGYVYMKDIAGNWAEDSIKRVMEKRWMLGTSSSTFEPERDLTRAEMAKAIMNITDLPDITSGEDFSDTAGHWAREDIRKARYYGIFQGIGNNKFAPDLPISREDVAVIIDRVFELVETVDYNNNKFSDVNKNMYSYNSIVKLSENEILTGYANGTFKPSKAISRAELATIFDRLSGYGIKSFSVPYKRFIELPPIEAH